MFISVRSLFFQYEEHFILEDVSFEVEEGEFVIIFGPNGGGKTTLLQLLMGFFKPTKGSIEIVRQNPKLFRKQMGYVPQANLFDRRFPISVLDVVLMGCLKPTRFPTFSTKEEEKSKAEQALSQVGMLHCQRRSFGTLSGGEMRRVLMARALVSSPSILLLDEPTTNIDPIAEESFYSLVETLKGKITILMVTHDLQAISKKADRFLCVHRYIKTCSEDQMCDHFIHGLYHSPLVK